MSNLNEKTIIICDVEECKAEFLASDITRQFENIEEGTSIGLKRAFFCCPKCGHKYTIDVTDAALRLKIKNFKLLYRKQERLLKKGAGEQRLKNNQAKLETLRKEIIEAGAELKRKWS